MRSALPRALKSRRRAIVTAAAAILLATAALWPTTSTTGVDYVTTTRRIPLIQKAVAFVDRDLRMRAIASTAAGDARTDEEKMLALLRWTHDHVRPVAAGEPVIDDHPYAIVERGYGMADQANDVLTTLAAYEGIPATLVFNGRSRYGFAVARVEGAWRVFDARDGVAFRTPAGVLATVEQLRGDPSLTSSLPLPSGSRLPWPTLLSTLIVPEHLRPYDQMPLERLRYEVVKLLQR